MSIEVKLSPNASIVWPDKCIQCGHPSNKKDTTYKARYRGKGYYLVLLTYSQQLFKITYPVCFKHKVFAKFCRFFFWLLLVPLIVLGLSTLLQYFVDGKFDLRVAIYFFVVLIIFILTIKLQPLRIKKISDDGMTLVFKNEKIAKEFSLANHLLP